MLIRSFWTSDSEFYLLSPPPHIYFFFFSLDTQVPLFSLFFFIFSWLKTIASLFAQNVETADKKAHEHTHTLSLVYNAAARRKSQYLFSFLFFSTEILLKHRLLYTSYTFFFFRTTFLYIDSHFLFLFCSFFFFLVICCCCFVGDALQILTRAVIAVQLSEFKRLLQKKKGGKHECCLGYCDSTWKAC